MFYYYFYILLYYIIYIIIWIGEGSKKGPALREDTIDSHEGKGNDEGGQVTGEESPLVVVPTADGEQGTLKNKLNEAIKQGMASFNWYQVNVLGRGRAGKSAFINNIKRKKFDARLESTVGMDESSSSFVQVDQQSNWSEYIKVGKETDAALARVLSDGSTLAAVGIPDVSSSVPFCPPSSTTNTAPSASTSNASTSTNSANSTNSINSSSSSAAAAAVPVEDDDIPELNALDWQRRHRDPVKETSFNEEEILRQVEEGLQT